MIFKNREVAGKQLAERLGLWRNDENALVLAIPRGGIKVGYPIAQELNLPLDVLLTRKLGVPGQEELAFGAVAPGGIRFLNSYLVEMAGITAEEVDRITNDALELLQYREHLYRANRPPLNVQGKTVILVDDGVATGATITAAIQALRQMKPASVIVAVPVATSAACEKLGHLADQLVCLHSPLDFTAVGQFYREFAQVTDEELIQLLSEAKSMHRVNKATDTPDEERSASPQASGHSDVEIDIKGSKVEGILSLPPDALGVVLFAHGSGSSRFSPRNQFVAKVLRTQQLGTLLFDLLTPEEEFLDRETEQFRFDIQLLAERLVGATRWLAKNRGLRDLPLGYFGASTGAAAALVAAARLSVKVSAVVSRGGRPDLALHVLGSVQVPSLFIVGGLDTAVIKLNQLALDVLAAPEKQLLIIPGATHLFEEPGTLEQVARNAANWFHRYFGQARAGSRQVA